MRQFGFVAFAVVVCLGLAPDPLVWAQKSEVAAVDSEETPAAPAEDRSYAPPIERIFENPAIASGLASGAEAINRSIESLMDALFYSLLDNELRYGITDYTWMGLNLRRDVYSTPSGAYVVVDRFGLGPAYSRELWRVNNIPVNLGAQTGVDVLQIYLRTDGMRLTEQEDLPTWRRLVNNWFGLLPLASMLLPPSFNPNEIYDPLRQLETPFVFPLESETFYSMPIGSIRSYAVSGGVSTALGLGGIMDNQVRDTVENKLGLNGALPYTIFKRGEHRINVFRREEHIAWVGLSDSNKVGHSTGPLLGNKFFVLKGALAASLKGWKWFWTGAPIAHFPIDITFEQDLAKLFDQVYEYDLRIPAAQEAYYAAVRGNFAVSYGKYLDQREKGLETGVVFHFKRNQDREELTSKNGPNIAIYRFQRQTERSEAEIEITDQDGKFHILEAAQAISDKEWDILVGEEETRYQETAELKVKRVIVNQDKEDPEYDYVFEMEASPINLFLSLDLQDRYLDASDYRQALAKLRFFTRLDLSEVPDIPLHDPEEMSVHRREAYFSAPHDAVRTLHVTPIYLGRFGAQATVSFSTAVLDGILAKSADRMWKGFADAFGVEGEDWSDPNFRASLWHQIDWFKSFLLFPLRIFNVRIPKADAIKEAQNGVEQLLAIRAAKRPVEKQEAFFRLFESDHPAFLTRALLNLSDLDQVPRRVVFSAQPKGGARAEFKKDYGRLNARVFKSGPAFPQPTRYARAKKKLAAFYLNQPREADEKPRLATIQVTTRTISEAVDEVSVDPNAADTRAKFGSDQSHVYMKVSVRNILVDGPLKLYVRVEQAGRIQIGKLELAEKALELMPIKTHSGGANYEFYLTGPLSPLSNFVLDQAVASGDRLLVTLAASSDGLIWSDERTLEFRFEKGLLSPIEED